MKSILSASTLLLLLMEISFPITVTSHDVLTSAEERNNLRRGEEPGDKAHLSPVHEEREEAGRMLSSQAPGINFEGIGQKKSVGEYYNGGLGGPSSNLGVSFKGGKTLVQGEKGSMPFSNTVDAGTTVLSFEGRDKVIINIPIGFDKTFSFSYSSAGDAVDAVGSYKVYSDVNGAGTELLSVTMDDTTSYGIWSSESQTLSTGVIARSIVFSTAKPSKGPILLDQFAFYIKDRPPIAKCKATATLVSTSSDCKFSPTDTQLMALIDDGSYDLDVGDYIIWHIFDFPPGPWEVGSQTAVTMTVTDQRHNLTSSPCSTVVTVVDGYGDADGVCEPDDNCLSTPPGAIVIPAGYPDAGCSVPDLCECYDCDLISHKEIVKMCQAYFLACVSDAVSNMLAIDVINEKMKQKLLELAKKSKCCAEACKLNF